MNTLHWKSFHSSRFWATCACPEKNRVALKIFTVVNILFTFRIFNNFRLPWKQTFPEIFHCIEYTFYIQEFWATCVCPEKQRGLWIHSTEYIFYYLGFWATCACPEKQSCPGIFHCIEIFFIIQDFWATRACPEKQSCPENFHCIEYTFYIPDFWATCSCPEKQSCPGLFHCIEYTFYIQDFWVTCACPEKQRVPWFHCTEYVFFIIQDFWATCACPEKQSLPWNFSLCLNIFYHSGFLGNLRLPWKQSLLWNFSSPGAAAAPHDPPPRTPMCAYIYVMSIYLHVCICLYICLYMPVDFSISTKEEVASMKKIYIGALIFVKKDKMFAEKRYIQRKSISGALLSSKATLAGKYRRIILFKQRLLELRQLFHDNRFGSEVVAWDSSTLTSVHRGGCYCEGALQAEDWRNQVSPIELFWNHWRDLDQMRCKIISFHGRRKGAGGPWTPWFWNLTFSYYSFGQERLFREGKMKFHHLWTPWKNRFCCLRENPLLTPWKSSFRRPCFTHDPSLFVTPWTLRDIAKWKFWTFSCKFFSSIVATTWRKDPRTVWEKDTVHIV